MTVPWREYQQEVAAVFQSLGCTTEVENEVTGARGMHTIDVVAKRCVAGVPVTWVIECKLWRTAVPKEKVVALTQIASDTGADRAFLLSESGFQSGAIRAAQHTNLTLTSLGCLRDAAEGEIQQRALAILAERAHRLQNELHDMCALNDGPQWPSREADIDHQADLLGSVFEIKSIAVPKALAGEFPITLSFVGGMSVSTLASFIQAATNELDRIVEAVKALKFNAEQTRHLAGPLFVQLCSTITEFLNAAETVLSSMPGGSVEQDPLTEALRCMKIVGKQAEDLRVAMRGEAYRSLRQLMRSLIDGPYLLLSQGSCEPDHWSTARAQVEVSIQEFSMTLSSTTIE